MATLNIDTNFPPLENPPYYLDSPEAIQPSHTMASSSPKPQAFAQIQSEGEESRGPSPQPMHLSVPIRAINNVNGHRVLRSATVGYIAPEFVGKVEQMKEGKDTSSYVYMIKTLTCSSQEYHRQRWMDP